MQSWQDAANIATAAQTLQRHLGASEQLLWSGRPRQGLMLRASDWATIPFGLLWCGFAVFWLFMAKGSGAPASFWMFGLPFVAIGLYFVFGRFWHEALLRSRMTYGVSNERVLIESGVLQKQLTSLNLRTLTDVSLVERSDGRGTITFGPNTRAASFFNAWPGATPPASPTFDSIERAKQVYDLVRDAQKRA